MDEQRRIRLARVFVSSTFQDMQAERDALNRDVLLLVQNEIRRIGVELILVDLRWGITKEEAERGQTAALCLDEIDECRPFFLGLIGDRYGWIPTDFPEETLARFPWIQEENPRGITELEMEYGAFRAHPKGARAAFLIKEEPGGDEAELRRRQALVSRVHAGGYPYAGYRDIAAFSAHAKEALCDMIFAAFGDLRVPTPYEAEDEGHAWYQHALTRGFVERPAAQKRLRDFVRNERGILLLTGEPGSGKSSLLAAFAAERPAGQRVIVHFSEAAPSANWRDAALRIARLAAGEAYAAAPQEDSALRSNLRNALTQAAQTGGLCVLIDGAEQLDSGDAGFGWLPDDLPDAVHIIISASGETALNKLGALMPTRYHLDLLSPAERVSVSRKHLGQYAKHLDAEQLGWIQNHPCCGNPLFLSTLLGELILLGKYEQLDETLRRYLAANGVDQLLDLVLARFSKNYRASDLVLPILASVNCGIAEWEMLAMLDVSRMDWSLLRLALLPYLFGGASVRFASEGVRQAARRRYCSDVGQERALLSDIVSFYESSCDDARNADILPEVFVSLSDHEALLRQLGKAEFLFALRQKGAYRCSEYISQTQSATGRTLADAYAGREQGLAAQNFEAALSVAECLMHAGDCAVSKKLLTALNARAREENDPRREQLTCGLLGRISHKAGEYAGAERHYFRKRALCVLMHDEVENIRALGNLGIERCATGDLESAREAFLQARDASRTLRYSDGEQTALGNLANIACVSGDYEEALRLYGEQRRLCVLTGNPFGLAAALGGEGLIALQKGEDDRAARLFEEQAAVCVRCSHPDGEQTAIGNLALLEIKRGHFTRAEELLTRKYDLGERCGNVLGMSAALYNLSRIAEAQDQRERAVQLCDQRVGLLKRHRALEQLSEAQFCAALARERIGDLDGARTRALEASAFGAQFGQTETAKKAGQLLIRLDGTARQDQEGDAAHGID